MNTQNSLQISRTCETNGCHDCINFSTSVEVHRSNHRCFPKSVSLEVSLSTAILSSGPKRLPPEMHLECHPTANSQPLLTIIWHESIRPSCDTVGDCVAPLPASSMTSGSRYPRRHHRALNSSGPGRVTSKRLGMKRSPNCAFAFSALAPVRIRTAPFSSTFFRYPWPPRSRISHARLNPFHSLFFVS